MNKQTSAFVRPHQSKDLAMSKSSPNRRRLEALRLERIVRRSGCFILVKPDKTLMVFGCYKGRTERALELLRAHRKAIAKLLTDRARAGITEP